MSEYIEREKAVAIIEEKQKELCPVGQYGRHYVYGSDREKYDAWEEIIDALENLPAADVVEVRHGRWIEDERTYPGPGLANNLCSVCGEIAGAWKEGLAPERKWAYCPACGALMDGKEDEHEAG